MLIGAILGLTKINNFENTRQSNESMRQRNFDILDDIIIINWRIDKLRWTMIRYDSTNVEAFHDCWCSLNINSSIRIHLCDTIWTMVAWTQLGGVVVFN